MMFARTVRSSSRLLSTKVGRPSAYLASSTTGITRNFSVRDYQEANNDATQLKTTFYLPDPTIACSSGRTYHQLTKIVATIGPTSEQEEPLKRVVNAGMKIMRLNFSHATKEEVELRMKNLALSQVGQTDVDPFIYMAISGSHIYIRSFVRSMSYKSCVSLPNLLR